MITRPGTYQTGFAPRDFQPQYPELWRNCIGAWSTGLGPTGATLFDWSGRGRHIAMSGFTLDTAWTTNAGRHTLLCDGVNDSCPTNLNLSLMNQATLAFWFRRSAANAFVSIGAYGGNTDRFGADFYSDGLLYIEIAAGANTYGTFATNDANWHHCAIVYDGTKSTDATKLVAYLDGVAQTLSFGTPIPAALFSTVGKLNLSAFATRFTSGNFDDVFFYNYPVAPAIPWLLSRRRGIAFEPRTRKFAPTPGSASSVLNGWPWWSMFGSPL